ncbi:MAG TPA: flagellar basal body P-ring formation chaperone FlgA [Limnochordales bacterium]
MRYFLVVILAGLIWNLAAPAAAQGVTAAGAEGWLAVVRVHPQPSVTGPEILLGEIAAVEAADPALRQRLAGLSMGRAALPGQGRELSVGTMRVRLRQAGLPERQIRIEAPEASFSVLTRAQFISGADVAAVAEGAVREHLADRQQELGGGTLAVTCAPPDGLWVVDGAAEAAVARVTGTPPGPVMAAVTVSVDGKPQRTLMVRCETKWLVDVWVVQSLVLRHQVLDRESVALELREFSSVPRGLLPADEDPQGWRAVRPLVPGTLLAAGTVERVPLVWRGQPVSIAAQTGSVWVGAPGIALEDGRLGDVVRVQNSLSGYVVQARVVGPDAVEALVP